VFQSGTESHMTALRSRVSALDPSRMTLAWTAALLVLLILVSTDQDAAQSMLTGVGGGALIAALALGVVLAYRGSGTVNVAVGALAMYSSYVFALLKSRGDLLVLAWPVDIGSSMGTVPALLITVVIGAALNLLIYALIFSRLQQASAVAKLVASVGLLLVLQAIIVLKFGTQAIQVTSPLSKQNVDVPGGLTIPRDQLIVALIVVGVGIALWALFRFTRFGLATRAAAENEPRAVALGYDPRRIAALNWMLGGMVVSLLAVFTALLNQSVDPNAITLLVVAGLGAALVGGFTSFGLAVAGGIGIGMAQALLQYLSIQDWFPKSGDSPLPGLQQTLPFLVIVVALVARGRGLPTRGAPEAIRLPFAPTPRRVAPGMAAAGALVVLMMLTTGSAWRLATINSLVGVCLCLSVVVLVGYVGQVSLAQLSIAGFAGFTLSRLSASAGLGFPIAPLLAVAAATLLGVLVALPALRIRGVQLAAVTMAAALAIENFVFNNPTWAGGFGGAQVPAPSFLGFDFGPQASTSLGDGQLPSPLFGFFCLLVTLVLAWFVVNLRRSASGRRMLAVRANERAAASLGIGVGATKVGAFAISAFIAGIAGVLSGYRFGSVTPEYFGIFQSFLILAFAYLGGISSVGGAVAGGLFVTNGIILTALDKWVGISSSYSLLIGGLGLVLTVVINPDGIAGSLRGLTGRLASARKARPAVTTSSGDGPPVPTVKAVVR
jgi:branched-chain amino acid transport system permease protein